MKKLRLFVVLLLAVAGGCVTRVEPIDSPHFEGPAPTPAAPGRPVQRKEVSDKRVVIKSGLAHSIQVVGMKSSVGPEGFLKIQINVQSLLKKTQEFSYTINWFDKDGIALPMAASVPMSWSLLPQETSFLAETSPTPTARDFQVTFSR